MKSSKGTKGRKSKKSSKGTKGPKGQNVQFRSDRTKGENDNEDHDQIQRRWKALMYVAVATSVFYSGYFVYGNYRFRFNVKRKTARIHDTPRVLKMGKDDSDSDSEEEDKQEREEESGWSYLMSMIYRKLYDEEFGAEMNDTEYSLNTFGFLKGRGHEPDDDHRRFDEE